VRDQFIAKLQRKKRHLDETAARDFATVTGMAPDGFISELRRMPLPAVAAWFTQHPGLSEILDRQNEGPGPRILVSEHEDALHSIERGYGAASQPQDYIKAFADFISSHSNTLPALLTVLTRPATSPASNCANWPWNSTAPASAKPSSSPPGGR